MSTLIVEVCEVKEVSPHLNADVLEFITVKGWRVIVQKSLNLKAGDRVVYFPPDSVLSEELANRLGILKYLAPVRIDDGSVQGYRVRAARLRGEPSYGTIDSTVPNGFNVGDDLKDYFGVTKYEPPQKTLDGDAEPDHPSFFKYTDIENIRNFPDVLQDGEEVVFTEKLHGKSMRFGLIRTDDGWQFMAGSHSLRRKEFDANGNLSDFWIPLQDENVKSLLRYASGGHSDVIVYAELIGSGVQDMAYGFDRGQKAFRCFDIAVGGQFWSDSTKAMTFKEFGVPTVPLLYRGPFSMAQVEEFTYGDTTACEPSKAGKFKGREGIVITPVNERHDPRIGRVILKSVSADYLARKGGTEDH